MTNQTDNFISEAYRQVDLAIDGKIRETMRKGRYREEMLEKYGPKAFLDPDNLRFPVINPQTGNLDCKLIYGAFLRASMHSSRDGSSIQPKEYYDRMREKAKKLYVKEKCDNELNMKMSKEDEEIDIMLSTYIFDITEADYVNILDLTNYLEVYDIDQSLNLKFEDIKSKSNLINNLSKSLNISEKISNLNRLSENLNNYHCDKTHNIEIKLNSNFENVYPKEYLEIKECLNNINNTSLKIKFRG